MTHTAHIKVERTGFTAECACGWLRYSPVESMARQYAGDHAKAYAPKEGK